VDNNNLFSKRLDQLGIKRQVDASMIVAMAQKIITDTFGERGTENIRVVSFNRGTLKITTTSGAWSAECQGILPKIKTPPIERVVFVSGYYNEEN